mmetsp:Transcript_59331/g.152779  ORF Transcript_59331/g.152779 Transcript_59331/m.152779 type:complete len:123 (-) Transcript_59331:178-546(-)
MPRGAAFAPVISRFMCMCSGYGHPTETPADKQFSDPAKSPTKCLADKTLLKNPVPKNGVAKKQGREVHIDKATAIPLELYWDMMRAGERAKNCGQHQLKGHRSARPHLVMMNSIEPPAVSFP